MESFFVILSFAIILAAVAILLLMLRRGQSSEASQDPAAHLRDLLRTGVLYEDEFIETYFKVLQDEGFMDAFKEHRAEANRIFTTMISESKSHRETLLQAITKLT